MSLFARWYDWSLQALPAAGGNSRHLFMAAYCLARQALVTDQGRRRAAAACSDGSAVHALRNAYQLPESVAFYAIAGGASNVMLA
jgi:hypothetical protein